MSSETPALCTSGLQRHSLNGQTMGTRYSAIFFAPTGVDEAAISAALFAAVDRVDRQMSTWKPDSDLSRLNALPEQQWLTLPEEIMTVLATALHISQQSRGAFDIGVGELVNAWGFGPAASQAGAQQTSAPEQRPHHPALDGLEIDRAGNRVKKRLATVSMRWPTAWMVLTSRVIWSALTEKCAPKASSPMDKPGPWPSKNRCGMYAK